jgi:hypothetical protein
MASKYEELLATIEALRAEINELKNRPGHADELAALRADLKAVQDELAAAKAKPADPKPEPDHERKTETKRRSFLPTF